jgi:peptidoglycan-associated lipoprotein
MRLVDTSSLLKMLCTAGLVAVLATGCSKPKKTDADGSGANADGAANTSDQPVVADKEITSDAQGSDGGKIQGLYTVNFDYDKSALNSDARKKLADNAEWIKTHTNFTVQIEGHTDERGSVEYNLALGERRAKAVKGYLETLGVESKRMTVISYGEEKPLEAGSSEAAWSKNRRANFVPLQ